MSNNECEGCKQKRKCTAGEDIDFDACAWLKANNLKVKRATEMRYEIGKRKEASKK